MAAELVNALRATFNSGKTRTQAWRLEQLHALLRMVNENVDEICNAVHEDLHKARYETILAEVNVIRNEAGIAINSLESWMRPEVVGKTMFTMTDSTYVQREPLGVVLIIGAWNYPIQLTLAPLIGAISAGNAVLLKPSEVSKSSESLLSKLIGQYLDKDAVKVFCGGASETQSLLDTCKFDKIFYTGNSTVARIVMQAAARHLTPVTLELGGKSPTYVDNSVDLKLAAHRIVWGKYMNCGQTCVAPDYILIHASIRDKFVAECAAAIKEFYGEDVEKSSDYGRIVTERHATRIANLLKNTKGRVSVGGKVKLTDRFIEPTIVVDVDSSDSLMQEEIFGPILPVITVADEHEAIRFINERPKPLGLYVFSLRSYVHHAFRTQTSSGALLFNDTVVQTACDGMPFGGVGESGCGAYHGRYSFEDFSHRRSCIDKYAGLEALNQIRYPPYDLSRLGLADKLLVNKPGSVLTRWLSGTPSSITKKASPKQKSQEAN